MKAIGVPVSTTVILHGFKVFTLVTKEKILSIQDLRFEQFEHFD